MMREKLSSKLKSFEFSDDRENMAVTLEELAATMEKTAADLRDADSAKIEHFGDG